MVSFCYSSGFLVLYSLLVSTLKPVCTSYHHSNSDQTKGTTSLYSTMSDGDPVHAETNEHVNTIDADASQPETIDKQYPTGCKFALLIASLVCGVLLVAIDNTIIAVAVPKISTDFC